MTTVLNREIHLQANFIVDNFLLNKDVFLLFINKYLFIFAS